MPQMDYYAFNTQIFGLVIFIWILSVFQVNTLFFIQFISFCHLYIKLQFQIALLKYIAILNIIKIS